MKNYDVLVTRHKGLVEYLLEIGMISKKTKVIPHASIEDVRDKKVIGVLPYSIEDVRDKKVIGVLPYALAAVCTTVTIIPLALTREDRGKEDLSIERIREIAGNPRTYRVIPEDHYAFNY